MNYLLMIFRSRNETLAAYRYLSTRGIACSTINAPRSLVKSCGLAIRTNADANVLIGLLSQTSYASAVKVYRAEQSYGGTNYRQIY